MSRTGKFFCGILINDSINIVEFNAVLKSEYGNIELISDIFNFTETDYYYNEMGDIKRYWVIFEDRKNLDKLSDYKILANKIEAKYLSSTGRNVNIDPGYMTEAKVVLASTKNFTHRIYIGKNIFAEVTLYFKKGSFRDWPWSYADYKSEYGIKFFNNIRKEYMGYLNNLKNKEEK